MSQSNLNGFSAFNYICTHEISGMKKASIILSVLFVLAIVLSSCRTQKKACAAYSKVEKTEKAQDSPS